MPTSGSAGEAAREWLRALGPAAITYGALLGAGWVWGTPDPAVGAAVLMTAVALFSAVVLLPGRRSGMAFFGWATLWLISCPEVVGASGATPDAVALAAWALLWASLGGLSIRAGRGAGVLSTPRATPPKDQAPRPRSPADAHAPWLPVSAALAGCGATGVAGLGAVAAIVAAVQGTGNVWLPNSRPAWALVVQAASLGAVPVLAVAAESRRRWTLARMADLLTELPSPPTLAEVENLLRRVAADPQLVVRWARPLESAPRRGAADAPDVPAHDEPQDRPRTVEETPDLHRLAVTTTAGETIANVITAGVSPGRLRRLADAVAVCAPALENLHLGALLQDQLEEAQHARERIVTSAMGERRRLARNLHDGVQQQLLALSTRLALVRREANDDPGVRGSIEAAGEHLRDTLAGVRALSRELYPTSLDTSGLLAALDGYVAESPIDLDITGHADGVDPTTALVAFLTVRETVTGFAASGASAATAQVTTVDMGVRLVVYAQDMAPDRIVEESSGWLPVVLDRVRAIGGEGALGSDLSAAMDRRVWVEAWIPYA